MSIKQFLGTDPAVFARQLQGLALIKPITFASATQTLGTVPANSIILNRYIVRTTAWDAITAFEIGKAGDTDWLVTTIEANVNGAITEGNDGEVEIITGGNVVTEDTDIVLTLDQGVASEGAGYVVVEYAELVRS